jgi:hypothetical protein
VAGPVYEELGSANRMVFDALGNLNKARGCVARHWPDRRHPGGQTATVKYRGGCDPCQPCWPAHAHGQYRSARSGALTTPQPT